MIMQVVLSSFYLEWFESGAARLTPRPGSPLPWAGAGCRCLWHRLNPLADI